jgi:hypothetical protein
MTLSKLKRLFVQLVAASVAFCGVAQTAQAGLIGTEQVTKSTPRSGDRARLLAELDRPQVVAELEKHGVTRKDAVARVKALTDEEARMVAGAMDRAPAGGNSVIGAIVLIFLVLLLTDILGFTKIFPFTRSIR